MTDIDFGAAMKEKAVNGLKERLILENNVEDMLATTDLYDLAPVRSRFAMYKDAIKLTLDMANALEIVDDETNKTGVEMATQAKQLFKKIDLARKDIVARPKKFSKGVDTFVRELTTDLVAIEKDLKNKIGRYQHDKEVKRLKMVKAAEEEQKKLQEKLNTEAKAAGIEAPIAPKIITPESTVTRTSSGSASVRKIWKWKLADINKVPIDFLTVDVAAINISVKNGNRNIDGIEIYQESNISLRTS